jgi:nucleoside-diphosphate-sugar epimerase
MSHVVLVTGATGFVGRHLVDALVARGDEVLTTDLSDEIHRDDVKHRAVDIRDADSVEAMCEGVDAVFHAASIVHTRQSDADVVFAINEGGTSNVIGGCRRHKVPRLVYVSSASVVYQGKDIENGDEAMPYASESQAPYADSKIAAEKRVLAANDSALATCAIRPHVVFGPGDTRFLPAVLARARAGKLKLGVGSGDELSDFTYVSNLIDALLLAHDKLGDGAAGEAYFVTNGEPMGFFDFVGRVLADLGLPPIRGNAPFWLAYGAASIAETFANLRGKPIGQEDGLSRFAVRYLCTHHYFSIDKARRDLGYEPRVDIAEGLARTCAALKGGV